LILSIAALAQKFVSCLSLLKLVISFSPFLGALSAKVHFEQQATFRAAQRFRRTILVCLILPLVSNDYTANFLSLLSDRLDPFPRPRLSTNEYLCLGREVTGVREVNTGGAMTN